MKYTENMRKGFTLIEILIVVAIIAILASVVLIGLGPTQQSGRDARRLSDLHEAQNAIELYFQKCGFYPGDINGSGATATCSANITEDYPTMSAMIPNAGIGINNALSVDPTNSGVYEYFYATNGSTYVLGATLENANNAVFNGYNNPLAASGVTLTGHTCNKPEYCVSL